MGAHVYRAVPLKGDPRITFSATNDTLLIDITSPTGIGSAAIEKTAGQWPGQIVMRLHVKGLENFKFKYGDTSIDLAVSSQSDQAVQRCYATGQDGHCQPRRSVLDRCDARARLF